MVTANVTRAKLAVAAFALCCRLGGSEEQSGTPRLDPASYIEPSDAEYWGGAGAGSSSGPPFQEIRVPRAADLSQKEFEQHILNGKVLVVEDAGADWPMSSWDCDFFRNDELFGKAEMNAQYASGGGSPFVGFQSDWLEAKKSSGAKDAEAPQVAPFYWGIKDVQFADAHRSRTWKKSMLKKVQEHVKLPSFMHADNLAEFHRTPEFWFAAGGAGAKAHMDTHIQATISLQLTGTKRWRMALMEPRQAPYLAMTYKDGDVYEGSKKWAPHFNITLQAGQALFFPPGFIHETLNVDDSEGSCTASVTFQFSHPMAARMYRRFLPRVRRTADIHEAWPLLAQWAGLGKPGPREGMPYSAAREQALGEKGAGASFRRVDKNGDGSLARSELAAAFPDERWAKNLLGFHDLDEDGAISREEFAEVFGFWAGTVLAAVEDTPKKFRKFQLNDMVGDFNIEDLPRKTQAKLLQAARGLEAKRAAGKPEGEL